MNHSPIAQTYLSCNLSVVPVGENKRPPVKWETFQRTAVDPSECDRLFGNSWGIAIIGGRVSDGVEFIDFDAHGKDIQPVFDAFMSDERVKFLFSKHEIYIEQSKSGGYHIVYTYECDGKRDGSMKLANWENGESMIETRGEGGYCIVSPTTGYNALQGSLESLPRLMEEERQYLIDLCKSFTQAVQSTETEPKDNKSKAVHDNTDPISWFNWNKDTYAKKILEEKGWKKLRYDEKDDLEYWQRPGKEIGDDSWSATWGKKHNALYIFTDSVDYFAERAYYTPFQILVKLKFDNNYVSALKWIVKKYGKHADLDEPTTDQSPAPVYTSKFPIEVFPKQVQEFITELNKSLNYSQDFLSIAIMFSMATLNGNKVKLKVKEEWIAPTIFWFAAVGEPGTMKSHPISSILKPIKEIDRDSKKTYDLDCLDYDKEVAEAKKPGTIKKPNFRQVLITDITLESLHEVHGYNRRGLGYYRDELVGFLFDMNRYHKGSDEQFWLESFNNSSYIVNRVTKRPCLIEDTNINIIGTIQPSVFSKVNRDNSGNGLTDRFLYTGAETKIYPMTLNDIDVSWIEWWNKSLKAINQTFSYIDKADTTILEMGRDALKKFVEIDHRIVDVQESEDTADSFKNYLNKFKTYLPRFALLMALFDYMFESRSLIVTSSHVERADKIMTYFAESARKIFADAEKASEMNEVVVAKRGMTKVEHILNLHKGGFKNAEIAKMMKVTRVYVGKIINAQPKK